MELETYNTLNDASLRYVVDVFFHLDQMDSGRRRRTALGQLTRALRVPKSSRLIREINRCFSDRVKRRLDARDRLGQFASAISFALKQ
eukprot:1190186-Amorphochlora_amoeboformis.AAC.1